MYNQFGMHYCICVCMFCMGICGGLCALFTCICFQTFWLSSLPTLICVNAWSFLEYR